MKYQFNDKRYRAANITDTSSFLLHMLEPPDWSPPPSRSSSPSFHIDKTISYGGVCCLVKVLQISAVGVCLYALAILLHPLVISPKWRNLSENASSSDLNNLKLRRVDPSELPNPLPNRLLDLETFEIKINADPNLCAIKDLLFLIVIHSKVVHFHLRKTIRSTWGGLTDLGGDELPTWKTKVVFILGENVSSRYELHSESRTWSKVNDLVKREAEKYQDLVVGSFHDSYKNLSYKHILGLKWASEHCSNAAFFIKADDDAFIDLPGLKAFLQRTLGPLDNPHNNIIGGNVSPEGTKPMRTGKWAVTKEEYPWNQYPPFLGGLAYIMTPDVARNIFRVAHLKDIPKVWVDDVWVTGILRSSLRIHPLFLNARYNYNPEEIWEWLRNANPTLPPPCNFVHLDPTRPEWKQTVIGLWRHIILAYNVTQVESNLGHLLNQSDYLMKGFR